MGEGGGENLEKPAFIILESWVLLICLVAGWVVVVVGVHGEYNVPL